ncbi:MAG: quinolinate synthase [Actinomycetota bacterium]|nr:quinolinate synthase [Actinomycetota bacterium]
MLRLQMALPERYVKASPGELESWIRAAKERLGSQLLILGHHYQRDEVMRWADARGDSLRLSKIAADRKDAKYIVFCGVHFMAEAADIITSDEQKVILPDLNAGCSMADMADADDVEEAWASLSRAVDVKRLVPITYINSSAALKAFVGRKGGSVCTSSNARAVLSWALGIGAGNPAKGANDTGASPRSAQKPVNAEASPGDQVLFFPDQHLGRNTAYQLGFTEHDMRLWDPRHDCGGLSEAEMKEATILLWKGHCSVHQRFRPEHVEQFRAAYPDGVVVVHPECSHELVALADSAGSTDFIIRTVREAPPGAVLGIGTEIHLVKRLADEHPDKTVVSLDPLVCPCSTMFRIDEPHLAWVLEGLLEGEVRNQITVPTSTAADAHLALERMLDIV